MNNENILVEKISKSIAKVKLNRPDKHNALSLELIKELIEALASLENSGCQVLILTAAGKNFCSGLDLQQAADDALIETIGSQLAKLFTLFHDTSLVTIACVQGHAIAGGGGLAASCDIVLAEMEAKIGFPETRRGIVAAQVAAILVRQLSVRFVRELLLTGQLIDSQRAKEIGFVNHIVGVEHLDEKALSIAHEVLKGAPNAIKETKRLLRKLTSGSFSEDLALALEFHHAARHSIEGKEGIASFLEKRPPNWE
jgi:methylglutaconyl-CoA hydratase